MSGWGHALRRLTEKEGSPRCSGGRPPCADAALFAFTYRYVTGRQGRVSWAEKPLCEAHAVRTAERHGLELPVVAEEGQRHASAMAVDQLLGDGGAQ